MPFYEHIFVARQDVSGQYVEELAAQLSEIIKQGGGEVTKTETWGLRNLAYRIKKNRKGHYVLMNIDAPHEAVAEMERNLRLNEDIIRQMTIRVEELEEEPSVMLRARSARDSRSHRPHGGRFGGDGPPKPKPQAAAAEPAKDAKPDGDKPSSKAGGE